MQGHVSPLTANYRPRLLIMGCEVTIRDLFPLTHRPLPFVFANFISDIIFWILGQIIGKGNKSLNSSLPNNLVHIPRSGRIFCTCNFTPDSGNSHYDTTTTLQFTTLPPNFLLPAEAELLAQFMGKGRVFVFENLYLAEVFRLRQLIQHRGRLSCLCPRTRL